MSEPIRKITLKNGTVRYRLVVDTGRDEQGHRQQFTRTFDRLKDARGELARIRHETDQGTYVRSSEETVNAYLDGFLKGATRGRRASTRRNYDDAFRPVRERLGTRKLQSITKADVEALMDWMLTSGRKRGGKPGTGLSGRTARLTLSPGSPQRWRWLNLRASSSATWRSWSRPPSTLRVSARRGARRR